MMSGKRPGDLVRATLVIEESSGYLTRVDVTGHAPLTEPPPSRSAIDVLPRASRRRTCASSIRMEPSGTCRNGADGVLAVTFIYTRCPMPDFCPLLDRQFLAAQREASADPQLRDRVHLLSITLDPSFDTPPVLLAHARQRRRRPEGLDFRHRRTAEDLDRFGSRFGVSVMPHDPSAAEVIHNLRTAVLDRDGRLTHDFRRKRLERCRPPEGVAACRREH